jgi:2-aminoethylphosphonate-pyruvate transaminase
MQRNSNKCLFTPGPCNLHPENISGLSPVFTRGDEQYSTIQTLVLERIRLLAGQERIACMQGSATTGLEVATSNFLSGAVLVVLSGYYSDRLHQMLQRKLVHLDLEKLDAITYSDFCQRHRTISGYNWIVAVSTETADAFLTDVPMLRHAADRMKARLMLDATGSINLERHHDLADVCVFSSCKGLGGLTGAAFITYNEGALDSAKTPREFVLDLSTYVDKKTTGPAHALLSLYPLSERFQEMGERVVESKALFLERFGDRLFHKENQPALCTKIKANAVSYPPGAVSYQPRTAEPGTHVVCHLFDQFPSSRKLGEAYDTLVIT